MITTSLTRNQIMPIYPDIGYQYKNQGCGFCNESFYVRSRGFIPFQFELEHVPGEVYGYFICNGRTTSKFEFKHRIDCTTDGRKFLTYLGDDTIGAPDCEECHFVLVIDGVEFHSELFTSIVPTHKRFDNLMRIEWSNSTDFGGILYQNDFVNHAYFDAQYLRPTYDIEVEGKENGFGEFSTSFQRRKKRYSFTILAPNYMLDALFAIPLHDTIKITEFKPITKTYDISDVQIEMNGDPADCIPSATISFALPEDLVWNDCGKNMALSPCGVSSPPLPDE